MCLDQASEARLKGFIHHTVRGFLLQDLYSALSEFLHKAGGSFGVQAHSPAEPGVVVVGSKGQPMAMSFRQGFPMVLFASETAAIEVPLFEKNDKDAYRLDLDSNGEVMRVGPPASMASTVRNRTYLVTPGLEIRVYSVLLLAESTRDELEGRMIRIKALCDGDCDEEEGKFEKQQSAATRDYRMQKHGAFASWKSKRNAANPTDTVAKDIADISQTIEKVRCKPVEKVMRNNGHIVGCTPNSVIITLPFLHFCRICRQQINGSMTNKNTYSVWAQKALVVQLIKRMAKVAEGKADKDGFDLVG